MPGEKPLDRRNGDAADDSVIQELDNLHRDGPAPALVADGELREGVRQPGRIEENLDDALTRPHDATDPSGEIVGEPTRFQRVLDHGQRPPLELRPGCMQAVVHRRQGQA
jgi:hypothetical protein